MMMMRMRGHTIMGIFHFVQMIMEESYYEHIPQYTHTTVKLRMTIEYMVVLSIALNMTCKYTMIETESFYQIM